jgi:hypothetical protein
MLCLWTSLIQGADVLVLPGIGIGSITLPTEILSYANSYAGTTEITMKRKLTLTVSVLSRQFCSQQISSGSAAKPLLPSIRSHTSGVQPCT